MSFTFNPALVTDLDWVRSLTWDITASGRMFEDETILAVLQDQAEENGSGDWNRWFAAAELLERERVRAFAESAANSGVTSKSVEGLSLAWGVDAGTNSGWKTKIDSLNAEGSWRLAPRDKSRFFRTLG